MKGGDKYVSSSDEEEYRREERRGGGQRTAPMLFPSELAFVEAFVAVIKAGAAINEGQADATGRTVSMLGDINFSQITFFGFNVLVVDDRAIDKHNDVSVLFNRTGFAKVGEFRDWRAFLFNLP